MNGRHESDDLDRYLKWRLERWRLDRRQLLKGAAAAALGGVAASLAGAADADAAPFEAEEEENVKQSPAQGQTLDVFLANHTSFYAFVGPEFERKYNAKINWTREQFGLIPSKLTPAFQAGGHTWDVAYMWRAWVEQYREFLTPLTDIGYTPPANVRSDWLPVALKQVQALNGRIYGLPSNVYTYVLYGNRKRLAQAGVAQLPDNYADFKALAKELTGRGLFGYTDGWAPLYLFPKYCVWLHLNGGRLYSKGNVGDVLFDTPQAMQATQDMIELYPYMPKESITSPWGIYDLEAKKVFFSGKAAMIIDYQHIWYEAQDPSQSRIGKGNIVVALVPGSKKGGPRSGGQYVGECFVIPKTSEKKAAALELIKFFSNAKTQLGLLTRRVGLEKFDSADESGFPSYKSDYTNPTVPLKDTPIIRTTFAQQKYPGFRYETRPAYQPIADTIEAAVSAALNKQKSVEAAHKEAQKALDKIVAEEKL